ncbi:MAG: RNA polymerase sigma-70 factor [Chitinophagaceae bacterium]|nr:RNA polymerase sigma-70 factor [Chitinophagaceae bacterium]MCW5929174.1 RNA polymerase sigma-70 factor [Chitinophagaceae bacterium]
MAADEIYNERELVQLLIQGNEFAFSRLFQLYHQRIGAFVKHIVGTEPVAEELVQDIFMKLWTYRHKIAGVENFSAYLFSMARNHMFSHLKKTGKELAKHHQWKINSQYQQNNLQHSSEEDSYYKSLIEYAVDQLPAQQKRVYLLSRDEGLPHADIAGRLGISLETVKKHITLALRNIRQKVVENKDRVTLAILLIFFLS